jgi:oligopeptide transport system ATP-binding protein
MSGQRSADQEAGGGRPLVEVTHLKVHFPITRGALLARRVGGVRAVDGISLTLGRGETLGLVGESGCGKSTAGRAILQLQRPTSGSVRFDGQELTTLRGEPLRQWRRRMQLIFQDPYASLDPRLTVERIIGEPIVHFGLARRGPTLRERVSGLMAACGLDPTFATRYPHEFSGGQRQRIGIARALASEPELVVADEPISALDVSIQAQILNLLQELAAQRRLTYLFISHDLSAVRHLADRVAVMYLGTLVEVAPRDELFERPLHPYTQALLSAVPVPDPDVQAARRRTVLRGEVPSPRNPPSGCRFHTRCPVAEERCSREVPALWPLAPAPRGEPPAAAERATVGGPSAGGASDHLVACHLVPRVAPSDAPLHGTPSTMKGAGG